MIYGNLPPRLAAILISGLGLAAQPASAETAAASPGTEPLTAPTGGTSGLGEIRPVQRPILARAIGAAAIDTSGLADTLLSGDVAITDGDVLIEAVLEPRKGGLDEARDRGFLRMAVAPDPLMIAFDGEEALGVAVTMAQEMENHLAKLPGASETPTVVVPTPMPRGTIVENVQAGRTDFTTLTVTRAEEEEGLAYTQALIADINDVVVLGAGVAGVETFDDLADIPVYLSESGRYAKSAERLNETRIARGDRPLDLRYVDGRLDDYDLIEMVEVGLIPATVASDFKARFWKTIYESTQVREDLALTEDGRIAWVVRSENPQLRDALDALADMMREGTLLGNVMLDRYASSADWIENLGTDEAGILIDDVEPVIRKYARKFDFEPDLVLAQAYQESRLDQSRRSHVGAIGVMQVMPATAADPAVGIPDVTGLDDNVHAGVKYLRWLRDTFYDAPEIDPLDRTLLAFAAYNAGPGGVKRARAEAASMGLDPNVWFENVEVAIPRVVSREPATYVRNIFKYYVAYRLLRDLEDETEKVRSEVAAQSTALEYMTAEERTEFLVEELEIGADDPPGDAPLRR